MAEKAKVASCVLSPKFGQKDHSEGSQQGLEVHGQNLLSGLIGLSNPNRVNLGLDGRIFFLGLGPFLKPLIEALAIHKKGEGQQDVDNAQDNDVMVFSFIDLSPL